VAPNGIKTVAKKSVEKLLSARATRLAIFRPYIVYVHTLGILIESYKSSPNFCATYLHGKI
jgi:hypothetical protein